MDPLAWLWHHAIVVPISWVMRYVILQPLSYLVIVPAVWLWPRLVRAAQWLVLAAQWLGHWMIEVAFLGFLRVSMPLWRFLARALIRLVNGCGVLSRCLFDWVLLPGWHEAGWVLSQVYRWLLRPIECAVAWAWGWTVPPAWRMSAAAGRWVRESVLRPAAAASREVLVALGLRRRA